ncbi:phytanoyl-CoA dioxygenase family protein [Micromonospora sp. NPDC049240]|uniref:phytanoyl-CoA dioxygenase family protein n=1 Tax=Micromonospora sp. NPDC049240 TaxID=3155151 RepID=UPI0033ECFCF4
MNHDTLSVSDSDVAYFTTFGFLHIPGILAASASAIAEAFEAVFAATTTVGRQGRAGVTRVAERSDTLRDLLLDDHRCPNVARRLLGAKASYVGGDGVRYDGATYWHRDGNHRELRLLKIVQYLEPLGPETGALRIIPGSHRRPAGWDGFAADLTDPAEQLGIAQTDVPAHIIECDPGDLIAFDPHSYHASFGGRDNRRQLTVTYAAEPGTALAQQELTNYLLADRSVL